MNASCDNIHPRLGEWLDGELDEERAREIEQHLQECAACRAQCDELRAAISGIARRADVAVPPGLWQAIESRLDAAPQSAGRPAQSRARAPYRWRPLAAAAVIVFGLGVSWLAWKPASESTAMAATVDFRPLLEQADGNIGAGIDALIRTYGGQTISLANAAERMKVRVHVPKELPDDTRLVSLHLLKMGRHHESLAFQFANPHGQLLLLQCPAGMKKEYGNYECLPCRMGAYDGHAVRVGSLRLMHMESENVCICVVTTLDEQSELPAILDALHIDF